MRFRYSGWRKGNFSWDFDPEKAVDSFIDNLLETNNISEALSRLLKKGFRDKSYSLFGIDDLLEELRQYKDNIFNKYNINSAREDLWKRFMKNLRGHYLHEDIYSPETPLSNRKKGESLSSIIETLRKKGANLDRLPVDEESVRRFEDLLERYYLRFSGNEPILFEDALSLFQKLQRLENIERALRNEELDTIDPADIRDFSGDEYAESFNTLRHIIAQIESMGYINLLDGKLELTPRGIRRIGEKSLKDIFSNLSKDSLGFHTTLRKGKGSLIENSSKPYQFGDELYINIPETIKNSLKRGLEKGKINLSPGDIEVYETESTTRASTALLIDMSWSMSWGNKFTAAKKVGIALEELIRTRFPQDNLYIIGFFTVAVELKPYQLPTIDLNLGDPFTNMQDAFTFADRLLSRHRNSNKFVILVTDGQPTAYFESGALQVEWPMFGVSPRAFEETLKAVQTLTDHNIKINTFMLDSNPVLVQFVEEITRINKGRVFFTTPDDIGSYLLIDYIQRRRKTVK